MTKQNELPSFMENNIAYVVGPKCEYIQFIFPSKPNFL